MADIKQIKIGSTTYDIKDDSKAPNTVFSGATETAAGAQGLVPAPASGKGASYLRGDGTWAVPTNTTYDNATTSADGLMSSEDKTKLDGIQTGADAVSFSRSLNTGTKIGTITINGTATDMYCQTDTNTTYTLAKSGSTIQLKSGSTVISEVADADTNTTYSAGTTFSVGTIDCGTWS